MDKAENIGLLVYPVIRYENRSIYNDISRAIFFKDTLKGFYYMEEMNEKNDGSIYCYWTNQLIRYELN